MNGGLREISADELRELLEYDPRSGIFRWRGLTKAGRRAGKNCSRGYRVIRLRRGGRRVEYLEHRLAWLYVTGSWPINSIDHINGQGTDNRFVNLREATVTENNRNRPARGFTAAGVRYQAKIQVDGQAIHLGLFSTKELAHAVYVDATKRYFGEFSFANREAGQ